MAAAVVLGVLLSACTGDNETSTGGTETTAPITTTPAGAGRSTTASTRAEQVLVLRHDGLGVVSFGQPVDTVMDVLTGLLGPPDLEEVQVSPDVDRSVQWDDPFLYLQFTWWDHFDAANHPDAIPDGPIFHYYLTTSESFATDAGIRAGSTATELETAYPDVVFHEGCGEDLIREFSVDPGGGWPQLPVFGLLDGDADNPEARIIHIGAGWDRAPC